MSTFYDKTGLAPDKGADEIVKLRNVLRELFEHCVMVHKYGGEICNQAQSDKAQSDAREVLRKLYGASVKTKAKSAAQLLVDTVNATGGAVRFQNGMCAPAADTDWIDVGGAYLRACEELHVKPKLRKGRA